MNREEWLKTRSETEEEILQENNNDIRLASTIYCVAADSYSMHMLWHEWHERMIWQQDNPGFWQQIGEIEGRPVCISVFWNIINGQRVMFYEGTSQVVDYKMVEEWLDKNCNPKTLDGRQARTDAMNFHNVALEIERRSGVKVGPNTSYCSNCNRDRMYPPLCKRCVDIRVKNQEYFEKTS